MTKGATSALPYLMTLSDLMVKARASGTIETQSGLMDGQPACVIAATGKNAERLMNYLKRNFERPLTEQEVLRNAF